MSIYQQPLSALCEMSSALSDEGRARIIMALRGKELCVCQIVELLQLAQSTVSKHLLVLKQTGFVTQRKGGRWIYYRIAESADGVVLSWLFESLRSDPTIKADRKRLQSILKEEREELCRRQCSKSCSSPGGAHLKTNTAKAIRSPRSKARTDGDKAKV